MAQNKGKVDALLLYKVDRLSRDTSDYLALKHLLERQGVAILSATENFEDNPMGRAMETIASTFAQLDNEIRAERSKEGMVQGVKEGRWMWPAPIGYVSTRVNGKKNVALDPREGLTEALALSWRLIDAGHKEMEARRLVNDRLTELGYETIPMQTFSKMLSRKLYVSVVEGFGMQIQSKSIQPLVEADVFWRVQGILCGNTNLGARYRKVNPNYPLRGILLCRNGHKMTASSPRGNGGRYPKYHCTKCKGKGTNFSVSMVEGQFMSYAANIHVKNDIAAALREALRLNMGETGQRNKKLAKQYDKRILETKAEKREVAQKNFKGIIPDKTAQELLDEYEMEEAKIRLNQNQLSNDMEDLEELLEFGLEKLRDVSQTLQSITDPELRHRFQKWLFPVGISFDGQNFGTTSFPLCIGTKKDLSEEKSLLVSRMPFCSNTFWNGLRI